ncbi:MAG: LysE family transporter [Anaerostipes sp.]|nr:LysE family transporter [Anaerostipes sp.]MDD3744867.1 LysE family transporter [Anaerostipes sp.]
MIFSVLVKIFPYSMVTAYTPGPNNILALNTTSNFGMRKGAKTLLGISLGFICVMLITAGATFAISSYIPAFVGIMKYIGVAYIVWLAVHIALSKPETSNNKKQPGFMEGFLLQFVNVKIILYAVTIYTGYVLPTNKSFIFLMLFAGILSIIGMSGTMAWAVLGNVMQRFIHRYYRAFHIIMALILLESAYGILMAR